MDSNLQAMSRGNEVIINYELNYTTFVCDVHLCLKGQSPRHAFSYSKFHNSKKCRDESSHRPGPSYIARLKH
jgi:hypothetical protein